MRQPHSGSPIEMQMALERSWVCNLYDLAHQSHTIRLSQAACACPRRPRAPMEGRCCGRAWQHSVQAAVADVVAALLSCTASAVRRSAICVVECSTCAALRVWPQCVHQIVRSDAPPCCRGQTAGWPGAAVSARKTDRPARPRS